MALVKILDSIFDMDNAMLNLINIFESGKERFLLYNVDGVIKPRMEEGVVSSIAIDDDDNFVLKFETPNEDNVTFDSEKFFVKPTLLVAKGVTILVEHFNVVGINYTIPETAPVIKLTVKLRSFKGDVDNSLWQNTRQSAIYKIKSDLFQLRKCGVIFDMTTNKNLHSSFKNAVNLVIDKDPILFYVESVSDSQYMMFKSQSEIDHDKFKRIVDSVRVAIGFLSGLYIGDNVYYFACKKDQGIKGLTYKYVNLQESVISKYPILDYGFYRDITEEELSLTSSQFNRLVELIYKNDNVMRAAMLITNAGTLSGVSKGTLASVALETMTSVVMSEQKAENIVEDKNVYRQLEYELKKGLKKIKSLVPQERYTILENKLQQINYMPNSHKLEKPFELMNVILDNEEKDIIKCRNKFLHGVLPRLKKFKFLNEEERVFLFSNKLAMLSAMLILRKIGYEGRVIDWGTTEVMKKRMILRRERVEAGNALRRVISTSDDQQQDESRTENV